jgi:hypothetical protein
LQSAERTVPSITQDALQDFLKQGKTLQSSQTGPGKVRSGSHPLLRNYLKMAQTSLIVIPAKAGQVFRGVLDLGFGRGDRESEF